MFHKILVAYDGSAGAEAALQAAVEQAAVVERELWLVMVEPVTLDLDLLAGQAVEPPEQDQAVLAQLQAAAERVARPAGVAMHVELLQGNVAKRLVEYAADGGFDLLALGQSGQSAVWGRFLGTTADKVVRHAPCSVLVVRPPLPPLAAEAVTILEETALPPGVATAGLATLPASSPAVAEATG
jgi:nucleotide-binding universal stress UspA family protein